MNSDAVDFFFRGSNFRGLNKNDIFLGFKIRGHMYFLSLFIQKIAILWVAEFVDWTLHENNENLYPTKFKPSTVYRWIRQPYLFRNIYLKQSISSVYIMADLIWFGLFRPARNGCETRITK